MYLMYNMAQTGKSIHKQITKPHVHIKMTQMSMKEGIKSSAIKEMAICEKN